MPENSNWYRHIINTLVEKYKHLEIEISEGKSKQHVQRESDVLARSVFRKMGELLDQQVYQKKNGDIVSPPYVTVFLSVVDEENWRGAKRQALMEDLEHLYAEKIKEIAGKPIVPPLVKIGLRAEIGLRKGEVDAEHSWEILDDSEEAITVVRQPDYVPPPVDRHAEEREKTIPFEAGNGGLVFRVAVYCAEENKQRDVRFTQSRITIGRNSETKGMVDLHLADDSRIARIHAILEADSDGNFWLTAVGNNPTKVGGLIVPQHKTVQVRPGQKIEILNFTLTPEISPV